MIRPAASRDLPAMVGMAERLHALAGHPWAFEPARIDLFVRGLIASADGFAIVLDVEGAARGMLVASFGEHPITGRPCGSEWGFWIDDDARASGAARGLIEAYEAEARRRGCSLLLLACLASNPGVAALYRRLGYAPREQHFDKAL